MPIFNFNQNGQVVIPLPVPIENGGTGAEDAATARANLGIGSGFVDLTTNQNIGGNKIFNGFTALGSGNIPLKCKVLSVTTAAAQNATVSVAHGLVGDKIVGFLAKVRYGINSGNDPSHTVQGYQFFAYHDASNFFVVNINYSSAYILSKPCTILVWYVE